MLHRLALVALALGSALSGCTKPRCDDCGGPMTAPPPPPCTAQTIASACQVTRAIFAQGRRIGTEVATYRGASVSTTFGYLENGRGPQVEASYQLGADGTPTSFTARGHHEMGTTVDETFSRTGAHAQWASPEEKGAREDLDGPAYFVPQADGIEDIALMVRAALAHGGKLALLPAGELRVESIGDVTIAHAGTSRVVRGIAMTGLGFAPTVTWLDADGVWFGNVEHGQSMVLEGWEDAVAPLVAKQDDFKRTRETELATKLPQKPPAAGLAFTHARVLDVAKHAWLADQTVVIAGDKIVAVAPKVAIPAGADVVDLAGKALVPGLVDMHAHLDSTDGALDLASGVTTVRDVGNDPDKLDDLKARWDAGQAIGPRVFRMGFVEGRNEKAASSKVTAETPEEAVKAVEFYAARKYDGMKIYNSIRAELIPIIAKEAHARGMTVTGHIPVHVLANEAVRAGYDGIEHINMLFLNFFATHDTDTRDTTRFSLVGDKAADLDLASAPVEEFVDLLVAHHTVIDPTFSAFEDLFVAQTGSVPADWVGLVSRMPATVQRQFLGGGIGVMTAEKHARWLASWKKLGAMAKLLKDRGVPVVAGTDGIAGLQLLHELALLVAAGFTPGEAIEAATLVPARALGVEKTAGSIAAGKLADLVVIDGDPLANIDDLTHVVTTVKGGVRYDSAAIYATVGVAPWKKN